jgi:hypothetical protein
MRDSSRPCAAGTGHLEAFPEERAFLADLVRSERLVPFAKTFRTHRTLQLQGCIRDADGQCKIRNPIYEVIFRRYFEAARASAPLARRETSRAPDSFWGEPDPPIRPFAGLLHVRVSGPEGDVAHQGTPEALFELHWDSDYRLEVALVESQAPDAAPDRKPDDTVTLPVSIPGDGPADRPVEYRVTLDSFAVDFTPREVPLEFPSIRPGNRPIIYFPFAFHTPPRPEATDSDASAPTHECRRFQVFVRMFEGSALVWECALQCFVGDPESAC